MVEIPESVYRHAPLVVNRYIQTMKQPLYDYKIVDELIGFDSDLTFMIEQITPTYISGWRDRRNFVEETEGVVYWQTVIRFINHGTLMYTDVDTRVMYEPRHPFSLNR